jgi:prepilin-type N-terminal cleavage/methylation domain
MQQVLIMKAVSPQKGRGPQMPAMIRDQKGFTLFELIAVMLIIGVLATLAIPQMTAYREKAFNSASASDLKNLKVGMESYVLENQEYPAVVAYR